VHRPADVQDGGLQHRLDHDLAHAHGGLARLVPSFLARISARFSTTLGSGSDAARVRSAT